MRTICCCCWLALICIAGSPRTAQAQAQPAGQGQPSQGQPTQGQQMPLQPQDKPAQPALVDTLGRATPAGEQTTTDSMGLNPDNRSLVGAQRLSLGAPKIGRTIWNPYVSLMASADSNPLTAGQTGWSTWDSLALGMDLRRTSGASDLLLTYLGSGSISNQSGVGNYVAQQLGIGATHTWHRYSISLMDQVAYLPAAAFGYDFGGSFGNNFGLSGASFGGGSLGLQSGFVPDQSILTQLGQRVSNTFITQIDRHLTPRSELTLVGSYGLLHYFKNNFINDTDVMAQAGYNHQINRKDSIALFYQFTGYRFANATQYINNHSVQLSYARRVTSRLTFQVAAGPDLSFSRTPYTLCGAGCAEVVSPGRTRSIFWSASSNLNYQMRRTGLGLNYSHGVNSGSGVLLGGLSDNLSGSVSRQFTRSFTAAWLLGYSRNEGFALATNSTGSSQTYNFAYSGVTLSRALGRSVAINLSYQAQYQTASSVFCITTPCGTDFLLHQVSLGFTWQPHPNPL
jgi:hypothetical protein